MVQKTSFRHWILAFLAVLVSIVIVAVIVESRNDAIPASNNTVTDDKTNEGLGSTVESGRVSGQYQGRAAAQSCPSGQFVTGIDSNGKIICGTVDTTDFSGSAQEKDCYGHGFVEDGFCSCDEGWTGAHCEKQKQPRSKDAPPDQDFDNVPAPLDCDDNDDMVYPGAPDAVAGKDNDCDGEIDEGY